VGHFRRAVAIKPDYVGERRRSAATRSVARCIGLLGSLLCQPLKKRVRVLMRPEALGQFVVAHVGDLCADPVPNPAHALDAIESL
jgi:hypothetical protein